MAEAYASHTGGTVSTNGSQESSPIIFYCKDCQKIVEVEKVGTRYIYKCKQCQGANVAFGTEKSVRNFFHLK